MNFIACTLAEHGDAILAIFNEAIATSTALYDYQPRTRDSMTAWFAAKAADNYPVIGAVDEDGTLQGFASYGPFRAFPAYKYTVEHSVYVRGDSRGTGTGKRLLKALIDRASFNGIHVMIAGIEAENAASIKLHEKLGFRVVGRFSEVGIKFGRWLDLTCMELKVPKR